MNIFDISLRFLFSKKKIFTTNISIFLSILTFSSSILISVLALSTSRAYSNNVETEISKIHADLNIRSRFNDGLSSEDADKIISEISNSIDKKVNISKYLESNAMIKSNKKSFGVIVQSFSDISPDFVYDFHNYNELDLSKSIVIGETLFNMISKSGKMTLFNLDEMFYKEKLRVIQGEVSTLYKTNISSFDKHIIFLPYSKFIELWPNKINQFDGIMVEGLNENEISIIKNNLSNSNVFIKNNLYAQSWKEMNISLIEWLKIFSNPIKLILFIVLLLSIFYQIATSWLIVFDKSDSMSTLKYFGVSRKKIAGIPVLINLYLSLISFSVGLFIAILTSYLQNKYNIYELDPSIYIINNLSSTIAANDIVMIFSIVTFLPILLISVLITANKNSTNSAI